MDRKLSQKLRISDKEKKPYSLPLGLSAGDVLRVAEEICLKSNLFQITTASMLEAIILGSKGLRHCEAYQILEETVGTKAIVKIKKHIEERRKEGKK